MAIGMCWSCRRRPPSSPSCGSVGGSYTLKWRKPCDFKIPATLGWVELARLCGLGIHAVGRQRAGRLRRPKEGYKAEGYFRLAMDAHRDKRRARACALMNGGATSRP